LIAGAALLPRQLLAPGGAGAPRECCNSFWRAKRMTDSSDLPALPSAPRGAADDYRAGFDSGPLDKRHYWGPRTAGQAEVWPGHVVRAASSRADVDSRCWRGREKNQKRKKRQEYWPRRQARSPEAGRRARTKPRSAWRWEAVEKGPPGRLAAELPAHRGLPMETQAMTLARDGRAERAWESSRPASCGKSGYGSSGGVTPGAAQR